MQELQLEDIKQGRVRLLAGIIALAALRSAITLFYFFGISSEALGMFAEEFLDVMLWQVPVILLMGAGTFRGSKPVRYIFVALLLLILLIEVNLFTDGFPDPSLMVLLIAEWIVRAGMAYLLLFDAKVSTFFLSQRAKNFGEWMSVKVENPAHEATQVQKAPHKKGKAALEEDGEEVVASAPKKSNNRNSWEDELGIFED